MSKVFMTKASGSDQWGFKLSTVKIPSVTDDTSTTTILVIKSVDEGTPCFNKLAIGDHISGIAGNDTVNLSVQEGYDLIKKCGNALFLTLSRPSNTRKRSNSNKSTDNVSAVTSPKETNATESKLGSPSEHAATVNLAKAALITTPPSSSTTPPLSSTTPPSSSTTPPSSSTTPPSSSTTPPSSSTTHPSSSTTPPSSSTAYPSSSTTPPSSSTTPPSSLPTPSSSTAPPSSLTTPPSSLITPPSSLTTPPSSLTTPSSLATPSSLTAPPSSLSTPPSSLSTPSSSTAPPPSSTTAPLSSTAPPSSSATATSSSTAYPSSSTAYPSSSTEYPSSSTAPSSSVTTPPLTTTLPTQRLSSTQPITTDISRSEDSCRIDNVRIPLAPVLNDESMKINQRIIKTQKKFDSLTDTKCLTKPEATFSEFTQRIPEKLLRTMNKPGMKPFTYTPRGVDLDEIMEKARKRQISRQMKMIEQYADPRQQEQTMRNVPRTKTVQQMSSAFTGDTYAAPVQQSRSFHKLTGWVNENASKQYGVQSPNIHNTSTVAVTINNDATLPYHTPQNIPSNVFKSLQRSCNGVASSSSVHQESICSRRPNTVRRSFDPVPSYTSFQDVTAHDRDREPEAQKYQGSNIPSRSFRMLQEFTHANNNSGLDHSSRMKTDGSNRSTTYEHKATADTVPSRSFRYLQQMSGNSSSDESSFSKYATPNQSISKVQASTALYSTDF